MSDEKIIEVVSSVPRKNSWEGDCKVEWLNMARRSVWYP